MACPIMLCIYPSYQPALLRVTDGLLVACFLDRFPLIPKEGNCPYTYALQAQLGP